MVKYLGLIAIKSERLYEHYKYDVGSSIPYRPGGDVAISENEDDGAL